MNSTYFNFSNLFRAFLSLLGIASLFFVLKVGHIGLLEVHFLFLILVLMVSGFYGTRCFPLSQESKKHTFSFKALLGFSGLYFVPRVLKLFEQDIWLDESFHYQLVKKIPKGNFILKVYEDAQPPLDYLFSHLFISLQGVTPWALKSVSLLWGFLTMLFLFVIGSSKNISKNVLYLCIAFFLAHPLIIGYQIEGRPYAFALMTGILTIFSHHQMTKAEDLPYQALALILCSNLLHFYSIGFQPLFLWGSLILTSLFYLKKHRGSYFIVNGLSFILASPFFLIFYQSSQGKRIELREENLNSNRFDFMINELGQLFSSNKMWGLFAFFLLLVAIYGLLKKRQVKRELIEPSLFFFGILVVFSLGINWNFQVRYILCLFCFLPFLFWRVFSLFSWRDSFTHGLLAFFVTLSSSVIPLTLGELAFCLERPPWKDLYKELNHQGKKGDHLLGLYVDQNSFSQIRRPPALEFYGSHEVQGLPLHLSFYPNINQNDFDFCAPLNGSLFILLKDESLSGQFKEKVLNDINTLYHSGVLTLIEVKGQGRSAYQVLRGVFATILNKLGPVELSYNALETLSILDYRFGKAEDYFRSFSLLKQIVNRSRKIPLTYRKQISRMDRYFVEALSTRKVCQD